jgi:tetratricopeptide (TPR) repeat protein
MKFILNLIALSIITFNIAFSQDAVSTFKNYVTEKDFEKAAEIATQVLSENPKSYNLAVEVGDVYFELENYSKALESYAKAREIDGKNNAATAKYAKTLVALNRSQEAIDELKKAIDKDKKNLDLVIALSHAYIAAGDLKEAELQVSNARSMDDKNAEVYLMLGRIYFEQQVWELARTNYEEALKLDERNVAARQHLADVYWKLAVASDAAGDTELLNEYLNRSLEQCNILVQNNEKDASSWRLKAQIHFNASQNTEAAQAYNQFLKLRPNNHLERWRLADLLAKNGVCDSAITHLKIISELKPEEIADSIKYQSMLVLGSCFYREKQFLEAAQTLTNADNQQKLNPDDLRILALSFLMGTDTANALTNFDRLFAEAPKENCDLMLLVGTRILKIQNKLEETIKLLNFVVEKGKLDSEKYKNELNTAFQKLAGNRLEGKRYGEVEKIAKDWIATLPEGNEFGTLYLAIAYQGLADQPNAIKYYREVLKINPENKTAKDNLKALAQ